MRGKKACANSLVSNRKLTFASFLARLDDADVPGLILGMDGAKPPPADAAVGRSCRLAVLGHGRNGLTGPFEVSGTGVIELLQHIPSSCGRYTAGNCHGVPRGSYLIPEHPLCLTFELALYFAGNGSVNQALAD